MTQNEPIRVVMVGCGRIARGPWWRAIADRQDIVMAGLVDRDRAAAESLARDGFGLGPDSVFDSLGDALDRTQPDAVFDCTIPAAHESVVVEALSAGCHVLGEKPLAENLDAARRMLQAQQQSGRIHAVIQNRRYLASIRAARNAIAAGIVGTVDEVHVDFFLGPHFGGFRDEMDDPLLVDMAIHTFDQARYLADLTAHRVFCHSFNPKRSWYRGDASAIAIFNTTGPAGQDVTLCYRGSWCAQGLATPWEGAWRIIGDQGTMSWIGDQIIAETRGDDGKVDQRHEIPIEPLALENHAGVMDDFVRAIRTGQPPLTRAADNFNSLAMVCAAVESARKQQPVDVPTQ